MSNIKSLNEDVYRLVVKVMARVGWLLEQPLLRLQALAAVQEQVSQEPRPVVQRTDGLCSMACNARMHEFCAYESECKCDCHAEWRAKREPDTPVSEPRTLDVSTEDIRSWPNLEPRVPGTTWSESLMGGEALEERALLEPWNQPWNTHALRTMERVMRNSIDAYIAHCQCGWTSEPCTPEYVAQSQHFGHRAAHSDNVADYGIGTRSDD